MPTRKLRVYLAALPQLEAQRQMQMVQAVSAGTSGQMKPQDRKSYVSDLRRRAGGKQKAKKATARDLAMLGIPVKEG